MSKIASTALTLLCNYVKLVGFGVEMAKKYIVLSSLSATILLFIISVAIVVFKKPQEKKEAYFATPTITKSYCFHKKTFPAPYPEVGRLPSF